MNFTEAVGYLYSLGNEIQTMKLGLESIRLLAGEFEHPEQRIPAVHIAGTNGKGSTAAMTDAILRRAGYRTGFYSSPHLVSITERVRVDGEPIPESDFARMASRVRGAGERLVATGRLQSMPSFFEQMTMIAWLWFAETAVDLAVLEVGMGGRLDATNICRPVMTAITPIGMDHQKVLGDTLAAIAGEKAGILKQGIPVVVAPMKGEARAVIKARAVEVGAPFIDVEKQVRAADLFRIEVSDDANSLRHIGKCHLSYRNSRAEYAAWINLRGRHQAINALTAIHIAEQLSRVGFRVPLSAVNEGLHRVSWPGRLEIVERGGPPLMLDGAHNIAGILTLRAFIDEYLRELPITLVFGVMKDKDVEQMTGLIFPAAEKIILTKVAYPRAAAPSEIPAPPDAMITESVAEALDLADRITQSGGLIVVCGSLYLIGEAKELLAARRIS